MTTRYIFKPLFTIMILALSLGLAGCSGDDDSPTTPPAPEPDPTYNLNTTVTFTKIECLVDGDAIEGQGDFEIYCNFFFPKSRDMQMTSGQSYPLDGEYHIQTDQDYQGTGSALHITFRATEWDQNIVGDVYADSDMNNRSATAKYTTDPGLKDTNYITLGNDKCKVRLHYTIASELVEIAP